MGIVHAMRRALVLAVAAAAACSSSAPPGAPEGPIAFRAIEEEQDATSCVEPPELVVALDEGAWIDVFDHETECQPDAEVMLPALDFAREVGVAAWWRRETCLGYDVRTVGVTRKGAEVVVAAVSSGPAPGQVCAQALGVLESFLALERSDLFTGKEPVRFVLDGKTVGRARGGG